MKDNFQQLEFSPGRIHVKMIRDDVTGEREIYWRHAEGRDLSDDDGWRLADRQESKNG